MRRLYSLYDIVACTIVGPLMVDRADAPVIRNFHDMLAHKDTRHPADYQVLYLGNITDEGVIIPANERTVVATGAGWLAAQEIRLDDQASAVGS